MIHYFINLIISSTIFFGIYNYNTEYIYPNSSYVNFLFIFVITFILISAYFKPDHLFFKERTKAGLLTFIFTLFTISLIISLSDLYFVSRLFLIIVTASSVILQWLVGFIWHEKQTTKTVIESEYKNSFQFKRFGVSFFILTMSLLYMIYIKTGKIIYYNWVEQILLLLISLWWVTGVITKKFYANNSLNIYYKIAPFLKSHIFFLLFATSVYYFLNLFYISRELLFGTIAVYAVVETILFSVIFFTRQIESIVKTEPQKLDKQKPLTFSHSTNDDSLDEKIFALPWFQNKELIEFASQGYKNHQCENNTTVIMETVNPFNFHPYVDRSQSLLVNLAALNDFMPISKMLRIIRNKLQPGGVYIGSYDPLEATYHRLKAKMPDFMFLIYYPFHFLFFRILPKLPGINVMYFILTKGKGRFISTAEAYGRLSYWGFHVEETIQVDHRIYFIAKLVKTTSIEKNPSNGLLVKLKRVGLNGECITIYKLRTMHPYSEFIQKEVFEQNHLEKSGKLKDDFRITQWGKVFRKLWIDELPQLINWVRGDVNLVGVRALSEHYFSLYPKELQELRTQFKPGLVPPYYADMPKNFDEILESERNYLNRKKVKPFTTDIVYFWKAFKNIVFKGARSK